MTDLSEDRVRDAYAWIRAHCMQDGEAIRLLADNVDLEELASDLAMIALVLINSVSGADPVGYLDRAFQGIARTYRQDST